MSHVGHISTGVPRAPRTWASVAIVSVLVALVLVAVALSATAGRGGDPQASGGAHEFRAVQGYSHPRAVPRLRPPEHTSLQRTR